MRQPQQLLCPWCGSLWCHLTGGGRGWASFGSLGVRVSLLWQWKGRATSSRTQRKSITRPTGEGSRSAPRTAPPAFRALRRHTELRGSRQRRGSPSGFPELRSHSTRSLDWVRRSCARRRRRRTSRSRDDATQGALLLGQHLASAT